MEPGVEGVGVAQTPEVAPGLDERVLNRILRRIPVAQDPPRDRVQAVVCGGREGIECLVVAPLCAFDEFGRHRRLLGKRCGHCRTHRLRTSRQRESFIARQHERSAGGIRL